MQVMENFAKDTVYLATATLYINRLDNCPTYCAVYVRARTVFVRK